MHASGHIAPVRTISRRRASEVRQPTQSTTGCRKHRRAIVITWQTNDESNADVGRPFRSAIKPISFSDPAKTIRFFRERNRYGSRLLRRTRDWHCELSCANRRSCDPMHNGTAGSGHVTTWRHSCCYRGSAQPQLMRRATRWCSVCDAGRQYLQPVRVINSALDGRSIAPDDMSTRVACRASSSGATTSRYI